MEDFAKTSMLFDIYGGLLTDKKKRVMEMYHEDDMSLSEIAEELEVSRAAVHDSLRSAERLLCSYEDKLGILADYLRKEKLADELRTYISEARDLLAKDMVERKSKDELDRCLAKAAELMDELD
ncbi:MAG: YlxM family DNA-binding protein [[Eubacterium] sulci]|nr:YlxM family DNA-binding protein [[Eubacterium] sulci]MBF1181228.1 YlxM family DNA-binding protein [[Eubacterium] sulci]